MESYVSGELTLNGLKPNKFVVPHLLFGWVFSLIAKKGTIQIIKFTG